MNKQNGQVFPLTALMLVILIGAATLAIDLSTAFNQQRRQQQDLDTVTKLAATGYTYSQAQNFLKTRGYDVSAASNFVLQAPSSGPYAGKPSCLALQAEEGCYVEGYLTQNLHSFFGNVLGFHWMKVSVHAAAEKGGSFWQPPALLALNSDPTACGIVIQGGAGTSGQVNGDVHSNSQTCVKNGGVTVNGSVTSDITTAARNGYPISGSVNGTSGNGTGSYMANPYNPKPFSDPGLTITTTPGITPSVPSGTVVCGQTVPAGHTVIQPKNADGIAVFTAPLNLSSGSYDFFPWCDNNTAPTVTTAGIYFFYNNLQISCTRSSCPAVNVHDSTFVFNYTSVRGGAGIQWTGGSLSMDGPTSGPFYGLFGSIAMWQENTPASCTNPTTMKFAGEASGSIRGIVDLQCTDLTVLGNSSNPSFVQGSIVAWDLTIGGSGGGIATIDPGTAPPQPRGAVLVQ